MANKWVSYHTSDNTTEVFNLERAARFRHVSAGDESVIEFTIDSETHSIMFSIDPDAYRMALRYIAETCGYTLQ